MCPDPRYFWCVFSPLWVSVFRARLCADATRNAAICCLPRRHVPLAYTSRKTAKTVRCACLCEPAVPASVNLLSVALSRSTHSLTWPLSTTQPCCHRTGHGLGQMVASVHLVVQRMAMTAV
jgi:hypothetical protein